MRVLLVGASGHLGREVARQASAVGLEVVGTYWSSRPPPGHGRTAAGLAGARAPARAGGPEGAGLAGARALEGAGLLAGAGVRWLRLDVRDRSATGELVASVRPDAVVNMAYVYGDWAVTADGAAHVAAASAAVRARLVHLSTDVVHGGRPEPYRDDERPSPVHGYGSAKAAAETAVSAVDPSAVLVRTSLIIGDQESQQVRLCLEALSDGTEAALFADEIRCPVAVSDLAAAVVELLTVDYAGPLNVAGPQAVSRVELGRLVAGRYGLDPDRLRSTTIVEAGLIRPGRVELDSTRAASLLAPALRGVGEVLRPVVAPLTGR